MNGTVGNIYLMYREGFRNMVLGRTLWKIIIIKLVIMFGILKVFFFPDLMETRFETDAQRSAHVLDTLTIGTAARAHENNGGR